MKVEILKENLKKAINVCEKITRKITTLPVLQNVLMTADDNFLQLTTTNLETTIQWSILAKVIKKGKVAVPAVFFANFVNLLNSEKVELQKENQNLVLISKDQKTQIQGQDTEEFPIIPKIEKQQSWKIRADKLAEALSQIIDIPSISQVRPEISGIYFNLNNNKLKLVATDSFRLAEKTVVLNDGFSGNISFIVPQATAREILNIFSQEQGIVNVYLAPNQVLFEIETNETSQTKISVLSRLLEGKYPNYNEIIPKKYIANIQFNKQELTTQIKKAGLFSGKILEIKITTIPKDNKIRIFSQSPDSGKSEIYFNCDVSGKEMEVSFNYRFLLDGLNSIKASEAVFQLSENNGAGILKPVGDDSFFYIVMPIKSN